MELTQDAIIEGASERRWLDDPESLIVWRPQCDLANRDFAALIQRGSELICQGESEEAAQVIFASLVLDEQTSLAQIQKDGLFRLSRLSYAEGAASTVARRLYGARASLAPPAADYLESVAGLHSIARDVCEEYAAIAEWLEQERESGVKGALATLDWVFLEQVYPPEGGGTGWVVRDGAEYEPGRLADGFSTVLAIYADRFGPLRANVVIDAKAAAEGAYLQWLVSGAKIAAFREWEVLVDRMGYRITAETESSTFRLSAPSLEFQRAVDLGFIHAYAQRALKAQTVREGEAESFTEFGRSVVDEEWCRHFVKLVKDPVPRYRFEFPVEMIRLIKEIGELMREERAALEVASWDLLASVEDLLDFELTDSVTMRDLFYVSRLIQLLRCFIAEVLLRDAESNFPLVLQSLVPALERDQLQRLFAMVVGNDQAQAVLDLLLVDMKEHIDVQYRPLIPAETSILLPVNVFANSNIYRNPLMITRRRLFEDGQVDPLSGGLEKAFGQAGFTARSQVEFSWNGRSGEVDVLVVADEVLLALECKNSLLPTGIHELMTSVDYVRTAADQLGRFRACWQEEGFRKELAANTGLAIPAVAKLVTGIVMANRMLIGYRLDGHAVRGHYELGRFVTEGVVSIGEEAKCFWIGQSPCGEDLRRFFEDDITYEPQWRSMIQTEMLYEFSGCTVKRETLGLNMLTFAREMEFERAESELIKQTESQGRGSN